MTKLCFRCGNPVPSGKSKFCSYPCYKETVKERYDDGNHFIGNTSNTTGAISELRASVDLLSKGWNVFRALSPSSPCDLVILKDNYVLKVEVRTARRNPTNHKLFHTKPPTDNPKMIDVYAWVAGDCIIYEPELPNINSVYGSGSGDSKEAEREI